MFPEIYSPFISMCWDKLNEQTEHSLKDVFCFRLFSCVLHCFKSLKFWPFTFNLLRKP